MCITAAKHCCPDLLWHCLPRGLRSQRWQCTGQWATAYHMHFGLQLNGSLDSARLTMSAACIHSHDRLVKVYHDFIKWLGACRHQGNCPAEVYQEGRLALHQAQTKGAAPLRKQHREHMSVAMIPPLQAKLLKEVCGCQRLHACFSQSGQLTRLGHAADKMSCEHEQSQQ